MPDCEIVIEVGAAPVLVDVADEPVGLTLNAPVVSLDVAPDPVQLLIEPTVIEIGVGPGGGGGGGGSGANLVVDAIASEAIGALTVVVIDPDGTAHLADSSVEVDGLAVIGVSLYAALATEAMKVVLAGEVASDSPLTVGPLYLGASGTLTTDPNTGVYMHRVGYAITTARLIVRFEPPIFHP
jgi:hypothetical protein